MIGKSKVDIDKGRKAAKQRILAGGVPFPEALEIYNIHIPSLENGIAAEDRKHHVDEIRRLVRSMPDLDIDELTEIYFARVSEVIEE